MAFRFELEKSWGLRAVSYTHLDVYKRQVHDAGTVSARETTEEELARQKVMWEAAKDGNNRIALSQFNGWIKDQRIESVSYTHLDVYKRQDLNPLKIYPIVSGGLAYSFRTR